MSVPSAKKDIPITHDFGIGFDLNPSYGTVAVSYPNGSLQTIARVEGNQAYREMMLRLSLPSSQHFHEPYDDLGKQFQDMPRMMWRQFRKRLGLPASWDAGTLSEMIRDLRAEAESHVEEHVSVAGISIPHLIALYDEDIIDAFKYISLMYLEFFPYADAWYYTLPATLAAYAGYGLGLCPNITDFDACREMEWQIPKRFVLSISYTHTGLVTSQARLGDAWSIHESPMREDLSLGLNERDHRENYWEDVRDLLRSPVVDSWRRENVTGVLLLGDAVDEPKFREILKEVVEELIWGEQEIYDQDPIFNPVRRTAELTKRGIFLLKNGLSRRVKLIEEDEL
ncbi:hypothetical protein F5Y16DRAFT_402607 [Xylariaceae sp. FL0255]|nr:hypothetical protein F5Y16DRAFT_402607 [Xylariaceae sp. FL0255]